MRLTTDALIIRENNNIGEADRFVTADPGAGPGAGLRPPARRT